MKKKERAPFDLPSRAKVLEIPNVNDKIPEKIKCLADAISVLSAYPHELRIKIFTEPLFNELDKLMRIIGEKYNVLTFLDATPRRQRKSSTGANNHHD